jgi:hypothetical protein
MAKGYTFTDIDKPTSPSASAVSGGSLTASTTYYYRVMKVSTSASANYWYGKSQISDQFSVTTDTTNKTARITFTCPYTSGQSYRIWRTKSSTEIGTVYLGHINFYPTDDLYNSSGTVTFDDDGSYTTVGINYAEIDGQSHGILALSGSTSSDVFSIVDLYNADVAGGWGVIQKLDINTYKVNCYLVGHATMYWTDYAKTIIFADGFGTSSGSVFTFGRVYTGGEKTYQGCELIFTSNWLALTSWYTLIAYRTIFRYVYPPSMDLAGGLGLTGCSFTVGSCIVQDCQVDRFRIFQPGSSGLLKNVTISKFDNCFSNSASTFNNVRMYQGSRVWQIAGGNQNITGRGLYINDAYVILIISSGSTSSMTIIDSVIAGTAAIASISGSSTGFKIYDKISFNLSIFDDSGTGIDTVNAKIYDVDDTEIVDVDSNSSGVVSEQIITRRQWTVDGTTLGSPSVRSPFTLVISKTGYETYTEIFAPSDSSAIIKTVSLKPVNVARITTDGEVLVATTPATGSSSLLAAV